MPEQHYPFHLAKEKGLRLPGAWCPSGCKELVTKGFQLEIGQIDRRSEGTLSGTIAWSSGEKGAVRGTLSQNRLALTLSGEGHLAKVRQATWTFPLKKDWKVTNESDGQALLSVVPNVAPRD